MSQHLVVDISAHGLGHLSQVAPVVERLSRLQPALRFTLRSGLPEAELRARITAPFDYREADLDHGMLMRDAISVDVEASCGWYAAFHSDYDRRLRAQVRSLRALQPDLLLADVPYLGLAAARQLGVPSIALCSLNWADIYRHYCGKRPACEAIAGQMLDAYAGAACFLQPEPSMAMPDLGNRRPISPIARVGSAQRERLLSLEETGGAERFILLGFGGIGMPFPLDLLPVLDRTCWIVPDSLETGRSDILLQSCFEMDYIDLLGSVDLVLTKTGYGMLVEAVVNRIPALCIERPGWPEEPGLFAWCREHGIFDSLEFGQLSVQALYVRIERLLAQPWNRPPVDPAGDAEAAAIILELLGIS